MPQKKIINISIEPSYGFRCPPPHLVSLTYDDHTKMKINMNGEQVANVLSKEYVGLKECIDLILSGSSYSGFIFKANGGTYRGTLNKEDVLTLFNESDYVKAIIQEHTLMDIRKNDSQTNDAKSSTANMSNVLESFTNAQGNNEQKKKFSKSYRPENPPTLEEMDHLNNRDNDNINPELRESYSWGRLFSSRIVLATALTITAAVAAKTFAN